MSDHNQKPQEKTKDELICHYREEVENIIAECNLSYRSVINYEALEIKINQLILCAKTDGIHEREIVDIIHLRLPAYVNYINHKKIYMKKIA